MFSPMRLDTQRSKSDLTPKLGKVNKSVKQKSSKPTTKLSKLSKLTMAGHGGRPSDRIFFIYDHSVVQREDDDPNDAIIYFYPHAVTIDAKCLLCGQLMGMVNLMRTIGGSSPRLYKLKKLKIATKHEANYTLALASKQRTPSEAVIGKLNHLYAVFAFYHGSLHKVQKDCHNKREVFLKKMDAIWDCYLPFIRRYGNTVPAMFEPIPRVRLPKTANLLFLRCSHILQWLKSQQQLLGGCILYKNSVLCSQLTSDLTSRLLLIRPNQSHLPSEMVPVEYSLPFGVRVMSIYLNQVEYAYLEKNKIPNRNKSSKTEMATDSNDDHQSTRTKSAPQQIPKVASIPSLTEVLTDMKSGEQSCDQSCDQSSDPGGGAEEVQECDELKDNETAEIKENTSAEMEGNATADINDTRTAEIKECATSDENIISHAQNATSNENIVSHGQNAALLISEQSEVECCQLQSDKVMPHCKESATHDLKRNDIESEDLVTNDRTRIPSDSQRDNSCNPVDDNTNNEHNHGLGNNINHNDNGCHRDNSCHGNNGCHGDSSHHGNENRNSNESTCNEKSNQISQTNDDNSVDGEHLSKNEMKLGPTPVVPFSQNQCDTNNEMVDDASGIRTNHQDLPFPEILNKELCASDLSTRTDLDLPFPEMLNQELSGNGDTFVKHDHPNVNLNQSIEDDVSNDVTGDSDLFESLQCNSEQDHGDLATDNFNVTADSSADVNSDGDAKLAENIVVGESGDGDMNRCQENQGPQKSQENPLKVLEEEPIDGGGDTRLQSNHTAGERSPSNPSMEHHQELDGECLHEDSNVQDGAERGSPANLSTTRQPGLDEGVSSDNDSTQGGSSDECKKSESAATENIQVQGMVNVSLYVQAHSDMVLVYLTEKAFVQDKAALFHLWRSVLTELGELEPVLKQCISTNHNHEESIYNFIQYDNFNKSLHSSMDNPVTPVQSEFCRAADILHHTFTKNDKITDVVIRNHRSAVYSHHNASEETFVQSRRSTPSCTGIPARDDVAFFLDTSAQKLLYREHGINIV